MIEKGGSSSFDVADRSAVGRSFIANAWPPETHLVCFPVTHLYSHKPIALAEPGNIKAVVTPPAIDNS